MDLLNGSADELERLNGEADMDPMTWIR
jgi:hypothetical protein